jgi:ATP-dependent Clp protease ATP-binding subunit ClpC
MEAKFSPRVKDMISYSRDEAVRLLNEFVTPEHLLLGLIRLNEGTAISILNEFQIDLNQIKSDLEKVLLKSSVNNLINTNLPLLKQTENIIKQSYLEAKQFKSSIIGTEHMLLTILKHENAPACQVLNKYGMNHIQNFKCFYINLIKLTIK